MTATSASIIVVLLLGNATTWNISEREDISGIIKPTCEQTSQPIDSKTDNRACSKRNMGENEDL